MQRTYSRKRNPRRSYPPEPLSDEPSSPEATQTRPRKRQKIEVEVVTPAESAVSNKSKDVSRDGTRHGRAYSSTASSRARTPSPPRQPKPSSSIQNKALTRTDTHPSASAQKSAKNLSDIFSLVTDTPEPGPSSRSSKPQSMARRMLGRSRTESSVISISSTSDQGGAEEPSPFATPKKLRPYVSESAVGSPSSSQSPSKAKAAEDVSSPPIRPGLSNSNIRTYAGTSRSFLVALPPSQAASMGIDALAEGPDAMFVESQEDDFEIRESYSELRERWGVDASEDDPRLDSPEASPSRKGKAKGIPRPSESFKLLPNGMINDLKSITELRSKGESRRFLDEVGYLFEGLDAKGTLGVRRSSASEVVTKLCDVEFARKAKAADFLGRAWEVLREAGAGDGDKILDTIAAFYAALVARDPTDLLDLAAKPDFTTTLYRMLSSLDHAQDPLWLISTSAGSAEIKAAGITKAEALLLGNLQRLVRKKSGLFDEGDIVSNRLLVSQALAAVSPSAHTLLHLPSLLHSLSIEIKLLPIRLAAYTSGLSLFPPEGPSSYLDTPSLLHLNNCLCLLDSCLLGSWSISGEDALSQTQLLDSLRKEGFAESAIILCISCNIILQEDGLQEYRTAAGKCLESALRVLINLTHDVVSWCQAMLDVELSVPTVMHLIVASQRERRLSEKRVNADEADPDDVEVAARCLDRLCLALGLLTNLVQAIPETKHIITETLLDYNCPGHRRCLRGCTCPSRVDALACLAQVYTHYLKSSNEVDTVVRGHMAVLFGLLMERSPDNQRVLLEALPGQDKRTKLGTLLQHAQDFTLFYVALTRKMAESQAHEEDDHGDEEANLFAPVGASRRVLRDSKGEAVAKSVTAFLQKLKDDCSR